MPHILIVELESEDFSDELLAFYQMASKIEGAKVKRMEIKTYDDPKSPPPSSSPERSYGRVSRYFREGHSDKGIKSWDLIRELLKDRPMPKEVLRRKFDSWPFPGRKGFKFSTNTFSAEFGKMKKAGIITENEDGIVGLN
jgi:hypothetical protein